MLQTTQLLSVDGCAAEADAGNVLVVGSSSRSSSAVEVEAGSIITLAILSN